MTRQRLARSRSQAVDMIRRGLVFAAGKPILKPGTLISKSMNLNVKEIGPEFVSRGGVKLDHAISAFEIDLSGMIVLDCGASTGGFTDCLLQGNAQRVYAVDVGYGQLDWKLRTHEKVVVLERTNLRTVEKNLFPETFDLATLDMSFISLKLVLEKVFELLKPQGQIVAMLKPQFEAGKGRVGSGGVIRDPDLHRDILLEFTEFVIENLWGIHGITPSPITGPKGNREFFLLISRKKGYNRVELTTLIDNAVNKVRD